MASKNTERENEKKQASINSYLEDIRAVDAKHKKAFVPIIQHLQDGSIVPRMTVVDVPEVKSKEN